MARRAAGPRSARPAAGLGDHPPLGAPAPDNIGRALREAVCVNDGRRGHGGAVQDPQGGGLPAPGVAPMSGSFLEWLQALYTSPGALAGLGAAVAALVHALMARDWASLPTAI